MKEKADTHFRTFAASVERAIEKYGSIEEITLVERQKKQVETLVRLERKFRRALRRHPWGPNVYRDFLDYITKEKGNILAARPYFRERQDIFTAKIAKALKAGRYKGLYRFNINYQFVRFVMLSRPWKRSAGQRHSQVVKLANQIYALRMELVEMNLPLAIGRARIFWSRTPRSHLSHMDLVQISCEGLMSAVDKFCLPYSKVFRSVAIGRIVGNFIEEYSSTLVHFYPQDKRKIYRANKAMSKDVGVDFDRLVDAVNAGVDDKQRTDSAEISNLVAAASTVSADSVPPNDDSVTEAIERCEAPADTRPDLQFESLEAHKALLEAAKTLTLLERKLLRMKGVPIPVEPSRHAIPT